jgi:hypothetical protein
VGAAVRTVHVFPADPRVGMADGPAEGPETVTLRLIDPAGAPNVEIAATGDGSSGSPVGSSNPTDVPILDRGGDASMELVSKSGRRHIFALQ